MSEGKYRGLKGKGHYKYLPATWGWALPTGGYDRREELTCI